MQVWMVGYKILLDNSNYFEMVWGQGEWLYPNCLSEPGFKWGYKQAYSTQGKVGPELDVCAISRAHFHRFVGDSFRLNTRASFPLFIYIIPWRVTCTHLLPFPSRRQDSCERRESKISFESETASKGCTKFSVVPVWSTNKSKVQSPTLALLEMQWTHV